MSRKHHGLIPFKGTEHLCTPGPFQSGRFARLFCDVPPLYVDPLVLHEIGRAGGPMEDEGRDNLSRSVSVGQIFFGQFVDHDITLDDSSSLTTSNDPQGTENVRTPTLDLDSVYGDGPEAHPFLYDGEGKLLTGADYADASNPNDLNIYDLPRTPTNTAIIGDPRNDENRIISQMHLGFLRFHNTVVDALAAKPNPPTGAHLFEEARRVVTWHYQWVVLNDFLRTVCGNWVVDDILANGRKVYRPEDFGVEEPFIPIEFATAAFRFGHTMVPQKFRVKPGGPQHDVFGSTLGNGFTPLADLSEVVDWAALLDSGDGEFERASEMDAKLAPVLLDLPFMSSTVPAFERSLAVRNLLRAQSFLVPAGENIAATMMAAGAQEITEEMISAVRDASARRGFPKATPLWFYILAEGKVIGRLDENDRGQPRFAKGEGLGPVGARFVAEVIIGLLELDSRSFMGVNRNWSPVDTADKIGDDGVTTLYQLLTA